MLDDRQLLQQYASEGSEAAFGEVVSRHVNFVYSTALRQTNGDSLLAQDAAQLAFTDLARKARTLPADVILSGWLHRATCFAARQLLRAERRRRHREEEAALMNAIDSEPAAEWDHIKPLLDSALNRLGHEDRDAVLLRFFEQRSLAEVGRALGVSEDTARKRVSRALEKLRGSLARHGATTTASAVAVVLSTNTVHAAPAAWAATVAVSSLSNAAVSSGSAFGFLKFMSTTKAQLLAGVSVAAVLAIGAAALLAGGERPLENSSGMKIVPGESVGPIKLGMSVDKAKKLLGKSEKDGLFAPFGLLINLGSPDLKQVEHIGIIANNPNALDPMPANFKEFAGATKEGIHIGSTAAEVVQAFGKPDGSDYSSADWELYNYSHLGLHFSFHSNIVKFITVARPGDKKQTFALDAKAQPAPSAPVSTTDWVVEPKVGIGPIKFHMTMDDAEKILGQPVQIVRENTYEYYQDGLLLSFNRKPPRWLFGASVIGTFGTDGPGAARDGVKHFGFGGRMKEGIHIGSTREEVQSALGKPTSTSSSDYIEMWSYRPLALTVRMESGIVTELSLMSR